jgi:hypothetical protein
VTNPDIKKQLHLYLRGARETLVWKLDGLSEYDMRRPLTPTDPAGQQRFREQVEAAAAEFT